jgi:hypothetical protein
MMTQDDYIALLFNDNGFTGAQRRDFLASRFNGRRYSDELNSSEKHHLIEDLIARRCSPVAAQPDDDDEAELTAAERMKRRAR